jgi:hypothetical protein
VALDTSTQRVEALTERIRRAVAPVQIGDMPLGTSVGAAVYPDDANHVRG